VMVHVTDVGVAVGNATVTLFSVKGGTFAQPVGSTNSSGDFVTLFTAPDVVDVSHVRVIVRASSSVYTDAAEYAYVEISPILSVQLTGLDTLVSEETVTLVAHVESNGQPVANASVFVSSDAGNFSLEAKMTYPNGTASFAFTAPETTSALNVTVTAVATKEKFITGAVQTEATVEPKVPSVLIAAASPFVISEGRLNVTVNVKYGILPLVLANVTITASSGNFSIPSALTNTYGNATFTFTAPLITQESNVTLTATATLPRYADGHGQSQVTVQLRTFSIQISASPIGSGESGAITVHVKCNEDQTDVADATVTMFADGGTFLSATKTTDVTGVSVFTFNAPHTAVDLPVSITANVTKDGYATRANNITITVSATSTTESGGFPWTTLLLIIIPVIIIVIVVVLVKLKVISFSGDEEEQS